MIDGRQIRAARAMLGWSRDDLLKASGISMSALLRMGRGTGRQPWLHDQQGGQGPDPGRRRIRHPG